MEDVEWRRISDKWLAADDNYMTIIRATCPSPGRFIKGHWPDSLYRTQPGYYVMTVIGLLLRTEAYDDLYSVMEFFRIEQFTPSTLAARYDNVIAAFPFGAFGQPEVLLLDDQNSAKIYWWLFNSQTTAFANNQLIDALFNDGIRDRVVEQTGLRDLDLDRLASKLRMNTKEETLNNIVRAISTVTIKSQFSAPNCEYLFLTKLHPVMTDVCFHGAGRPTWSRQVHGRLDSRFIAAAKTVIMMIRCRNETFKVQRDLLDYLLERVFWAHLDYLETETLALKSEVRQLIQVANDSYGLADGMVDVCRKRGYHWYPYYADERARTMEARKESYLVVYLYKIARSKLKLSVGLRDRIMALTRVIIVDDRNRDRQMAAISELVLNKIESMGLTGVAIFKDKSNIDLSGLELPVDW